MEQESESPSLEAWDPGGVYRAQLPEPPVGQSTSEWEALADSIPARVLPPDPFDQMASGWQFLLSAPAGRAWYVLAWESFETAAATPQEEWEAPQAPDTPDAGELDLANTPRDAAWFARLREAEATAAARESAIVDERDEERRRQNERESAERDAARRKAETEQMWERERAEEAEHAASLSGRAEKATEAASARVRGSKAGELASKGGGAASRAWRWSGLTFKQEYVVSNWQSNGGKSALRFVLAIPLAGFLLSAFQNLGQPQYVLALAVFGSWFLLPALYLFRHVPFKSSPYRCESCGAIWAGRKLCSSCKRVVRDPEGHPAMRRAWRSL